MSNTFSRICFNEISKGHGRGFRSSGTAARSISRSIFGLSSLVALCYVLAGCGAQMTTNGGALSQGSFTASPTSVDFGSVSVGNSANNTVSLVNSSSDPVVVSKLSVSGNSKFSLVDASQLPLTLAAGTTTSVKIHYGPTQAADDSGTLNISSNSASVPSTTIKLHGKGLKAGSVTPAISALACANASITGAGTDSCTATISSAAPTDGFSIGLGSSSAVLTVPSTVTVPSGSTTVSFTATAAAVTSTQSVILTGNGGGATKAFTVQLKPSSSSSGSGATLAGLSCSSASMSAAGTDACTVTLSAAAPAGGVAVALASNNAAAKVPASVSVAANATSASFSTTVSAVKSATAVTLTATANSVAKTFALTLNPASSSGSAGTLSINSTTVAFGDVLVKTSSTQAVTLNATGSAVTITGATPSGTGFSVSGTTFPMTVTPGTAATINVAFSPTAAGAVSGKLTIANNSSNNSSAAIALTGTGTTHQVGLTWQAPTDTSDPATGYKVYRTTSGSSAYTLLNSAATASLTYTDTTAQSGTTYDYYVTSVDSSGSESTPSNTATVVVP